MVNYWERIKLGNVVLHKVFLRVLRRRRKQILLIYTCVIKKKMIRNTY